MRTIYKESLRLKKKASRKDLLLILTIGLFSYVWLKMYDMASPSDNLRLQTEEMTGLPNILHSKLVPNSQ